MQHRPGSHRFDDFSIVNEPRRRHLYLLLARGFVAGALARMRPRRRHPGPPDRRTKFMDQGEPGE